MGSCDAGEGTPDGAADAGPALCSDVSEEGMQARHGRLPQGAAEDPASVKRGRKLVENMGGV